MIFPNYLVYTTKSYNGFPELQLKEAAYKDLNSLSIQADNIDALHEEIKYSNKNRYIKKFRYKLFENTSKKIKNLFNYKEFAQNVYERVYAELDAKEKKQIEAFLKIEPSTSLFNKISQIENKIKGAINYNKLQSNNMSIPKTLELKTGGDADIVRLYIGIFKQNDIKNELVLTTNRFDNYFDEDFETTGNLTKFLFYFPDADIYLDPLNVNQRIPLFPFGYGNNKGLFIKEKEFGGAKMGVGKVQFIKLPNNTKDTMTIYVDLSKDIEKAEVKSELKFTGYAANGFQGIKDFVSADQYKNIIKDIADNYGMNPQEYDYIRTQNDGINNIGKKPFILETKFKMPELVQKVADTYLIKIGETIGRQSELYEDKERNIPVELQYTRHYYRRIIINLPHGYQITNPEVCNSHFETVVEGRKDALWDCKYSFENNTFKIINIEYYDAVEYPLSHFKSYRDVINAAADFNKVVLVLKKL